MRRIAILLLAALFAREALGQQPNQPLSTLSINGTGRIDALGIPVPDNSWLSPTPPGSAPTFHHRTAPGVSLGFEVKGPPLKPIILLAGQPGAPTPVGSDLFELDIATTQVLLNGLSPANLFDQGAFTGFDGRWRFFSPIGLPPGIPPITLQAIVYDPSHPPFSLRFTASVTLAVDPSIDVLTRNFADSLTQVVENPLYLHSTMATTSLLDGLDRSAFTTVQSGAQLGLFDDFPVDRYVLEQIGPDQPLDPALPTGGPTAAQVRTIYLQARGQGTTNPCSAGAPLGDRFRFHDLQVKEEGGVWKIDGNQRDAAIDAELLFQPGGTNLAGIDCELRFELEDQAHQHGGILGATVSGPQLLGINFNSESTSAAFGSQPFQPSYPGSSDWEFRVRLAVSAAGSSRFPLVEDATGPRDSYLVTISWNDGTTSGPYTLDLRAALDVNANPLGVLAAVPATNGVLAALSSGGLANASIAASFDFGNLPAPHFGSLGVQFLQSGPMDLESDTEIFPPFSPGATFGGSFCAPGFMSGSCFVIVEVADEYGTHYARGASITL